MQVLALVGDQIDYGENICGAVLSIRFNEDILSVWNRNASDNQVAIIVGSVSLHLYATCLDILFTILFSQSRL